MLLSLIMASINADLSTKIFWIKVFNIFIILAVLSWLALTLKINGHGKWLSFKYTAIGSIIPSLVVLLMCVNESNISFFSKFWMEGNNLRGTYGFIGILSMSVGYLILLFSIIMFLIGFRKIRGVLRTQAGILIISTCITVVGHFIWRFAPTPDLRQDLLAITFFISGCLDIFALFQLRMFDIVTVAQNVVTQTMGDGLAVLDRQGFVIGMNPAAEKLINRSSREILGQDSADVFKSWPHELGDLIQKAETGICEIEMNQIWFHIMSTSLSGSNNRYLGKALVFHDITAGKKAQERLLEQEYALAVLKERERLGRELHDGQGQLVGYFQMQLEAVRSLIANGQAEKAEPILKQLVAHTQGLNTEIRESISELKSTITDGSILSTLDEYLTWFGRNYGIETGFAVSGDYSDKIISPLIAVQVQRIIQEAMVNVRKHANARKLNVKINIFEDMAEITIENDGPGFDVEKALQKKGSYGLHIMRERAEEIGAEFRVISSITSGTVIKLLVPLNKSRQA